MCTIIYSLLSHFFPQQIFYYSESIFEGAGVSIDHIPYAIIGTGVINLATTLNSVNILNFWLIFFSDFKLDPA